jgi:hypothetical protein
MKRYTPFTDGRRVILSKKSSSQLMKQGGPTVRFVKDSSHLWLKYGRLPFGWAFSFFGSYS